MRTATYSYFRPFKYPYFPRFSSQSGVFRSHLKVPLLLLTKLLEHASKFHFKKWASLPPTQVTHNENWFWTHSSLHFGPCFACNDSLISASLLILSSFTLIQNDPPTYASVLSFPSLSLWSSPTKTQVHSEASQLGSLFLQEYLFASSLCESINWLVQASASQCFNLSIYLMTLTFSASSWLVLLVHRFIGLFD